MKNLRISSVNVIDSTNISIQFTENLTKNLVNTNVIITSDTTGVVDSIVLTITVQNNILLITNTPLVPFANYYITLKSVSGYPFISLNGDAQIIQDNVNNKYLITAPIESDNPVKLFFQSYFKDNIYTTSNTLISSYLDSLSTNLSKALYDIGQLKNENYLSFEVIDEKKTRGSGPFDRLNEESAYEIIRVGLNQTNATLTTNIITSSFPNFPITLQQKQYSEILTPNSFDKVGNFNINTLILNLTKSPITQVTNITFILSTGNPNYTYNIDLLGYQLLNSRYDQNFASTYLLLNDNQVKINEQILNDPNFSIINIISVNVTYQYKDLGLVIDNSTVNVFTILKSVRETIPSIINIFNLQNAPITDSNGNNIIINGVIFTDPNNPGNAHPAFITEIPFRLNALPYSVGQYSINYSNGTVYVYGSSSIGDGTGAYPPLATYYYKYTYVSQQDYIYDQDSNDLVALPIGNLINYNATINYNYEQVLIPNIDYKADLHIENLEERVNNNLLALNVFKVQNYPITNVFQILNETSCEIYAIDRWDNNKIYFRYNKAPNIQQQNRELATFETIINELLSINATFTNINSLRIFKILLNNNTIISGTEDSIGSSINTSIIFSNNNIFINEKYYNNTNVTTYNNLTNIGDYTIDYINGIIFVAVSTHQLADLGTISYKINNIKLNFPHIISVNNIYYSILQSNPNNKTFNYASFKDGSIESITTLDLSAETLLNNTFPYQLYNNSIGIFNNSSFISGISNQIDFIRGVYEYKDLLNSSSPLNFINSSSFSGSNVTVNSITNQFTDKVKYDGTNYYVLIYKDIPYISSNITYSFSIIRASDSAQLWDSYGTISPGNPLKLILSGAHSPIIGDLINITYTFTINNLSNIAIDYNKGYFYIDYTYLADEIIVSYEYGDNVLDFTESNLLPIGDTYYVSYKVGALRAALENNFGNLINIPELTNFEIDFNRERYRDALTAALSSFLQGPTKGAISNIAQTISHIKPQIIESVFNNWSLGNSFLYSNKINVTGMSVSLPAKFNNGLLINNLDQTITFPNVSNIRFEEGTFEIWADPQWNGIDNSTELSFTILVDNAPVNRNLIYIGAEEMHPTINSNNIFTVDKSIIYGVPNKNKNGIFIYYYKDISGEFNRWYVEVVDIYRLYITSYKFKITTNGQLYNSTSITNPQPTNMKMFSSQNSINFTISDYLQIEEGVTFVADKDHYLLDFGEDKTKNRISIYKDISGYLNFRIYDKFKNSYMISSNISNWIANDFHHIAASWKLNNHYNDEMHLFIDGLEVPNIIKYGQKLNPYLNENFDTINSENIIGLSNKDIVSSIDMITTAGSAVVTSSIDFSEYNINIGDIIIINEIGFNTNGYTILNINGQSLTLNSLMPLSLTDITYYINKTDFIVTTDIDLAANIAVSRIPLFIDGYVSGTVDSNTITSTTNFITSNVEPGYIIHIYNNSLNIFYTILEVHTNSLVINSTIPINFTNNNFNIYSNSPVEIPGTRALRPSYLITKDDNFNNILTAFNNIYEKDLIIINTLGLNFRSIKKNYYLWSNNIENIITTQLPPPVSLNEAFIYRVILPTTTIGWGVSWNNSGITSFMNINGTNPFGGSPPYQPIASDNGRTLSVTLNGTNIDFTSIDQVIVDGYLTPYIFIDGYNNSTPITEIIQFSNYNTINTINKFTSIQNIGGYIIPISLTKNVGTIGIKEYQPLTIAENSNLVANIAYSYETNSGTSLYKNSSNIITDIHNMFSYEDIGNYIIINSPPSVAGSYGIISLSEDRHSLTIYPISAPALPLASFINGNYIILNSTQDSSGLQNGFFTFEQLANPGTPYVLPNGFYEFNYNTLLKIKLDPINTNVYLGSDFKGCNQIDAILDELKIYSVMLTDTRIGEVVPSNQTSITKDYNSLKLLNIDSTTLMFVNFDNLPLVNSANLYTNNTKQFLSLNTINSNFNNSIAIKDKSIILSNDGILDTKKQATIEFWINPMIDTGNDYNDRFYFDAFGAIVEEAVSVNNVSVKISQPASQILSVVLKDSNDKIDYFAGGKLKIDTQKAIIRTTISINSTVVVLPIHYEQNDNFILQIISVTIAGDLTNTDYFANGNVGTDGITIYLGKELPENYVSVIITYQSTNNNNNILNTQIILLNKELPYQNANVIVTYLSKNIQGDRISIYKDTNSGINFGIIASGQTFNIRAEKRWASNSWHRIKASYIFGNNSNDQMKLFIDGYEYSHVFINKLNNFGEFPTLYNFSIDGDGYDGYSYDGYDNNLNINFKDPINYIFIGSEYNYNSPMFGLIDNYRISNISRPIYAPYGESLDVNYNSNLSMNFPVTKDLYTTYLLDSNSISTKITDFTILRNKNSGLFDFTVNVIDSLDIVNSNVKSQNALEKLINILKPANSRAFINYI